MFAVEVYAAVRRFVFIEGKSRREAARVFGLSRDTIAKMCRYSAPPGYVRSKQPERPKLQLGRTRRSGSRGDFAGLGIGGYGFLISGLGHPPPPCRRLLEPVALA